MDGTNAHTVCVLTLARPDRFIGFLTNVTICGCVVGIVVGMLIDAADVVGCCWPTKNADDTVVDGIDVGFCSVITCFVLFCVVFKLRTDELVVFMRGTFKRKPELGDVDDWICAGTVVVVVDVGNDWDAVFGECMMRTFVAAFKMEFVLVIIFRLMLFELSLGVTDAAAANTAILFDVDDDVEIACIVLDAGVTIDNGTIFNRSDVFVSIGKPLSNPLLVLARPLTTSVFILLLRKLLRNASVLFMSVSFCI